MTHHRPLAVLAPIAAAALLIAACGGDDSSTTSVASSVTTTAATPVPTTTITAAAPEAAPMDGKVAAGDSRLAIYPTNYVLAGELVAIDGPVAAWTWPTGVTATADAMQAVALALGVAGELTAVPAEEGGGWSIGADGEARIWFSTDALASWSYSAPGAAVPCITSSDTEAIGGDVAVVDPVAPDQGTDASTLDTTVAPPVVDVCAPPVDIPSADAARAAALELMGALGLDPAGHELTTDSQEWGAWVDARLIVDGIPAPVSTSIGFGSGGVVTYASGQLLAPQPAGAYERIGTTAGFERLQQRQDTFYGISPEVDPAVDAVPADDAPATDTPAAGSTADPDAPVAAPVGAPSSEPVTIDTVPEPIDVTIVAVDADWWPVWAEDGTVWLFPAYAYVTDQGERITIPAVPDAELGALGYGPTAEAGAIEPSTQPPGTVLASEPAAEPAPAG